MTEEAINALTALARLPIEEEHPRAPDDRTVLLVGFGESESRLTVGHVRAARAALDAAGRKY